MNEQCAIYSTLFIVPGFKHESVYFLRTSWWSTKSFSSGYQRYNLLKHCNDISVSYLVQQSHLKIALVEERLVPQAPYLVEHTAIAPHITSRGVLFVFQCLRGCPLDWDLPTLWDIVVSVLQISGHAKICNLCERGDLREHFFLHAQANQNAASLWHSEQTPHTPPLWFGVPIFELWPSFM